MATTSMEINLDEDLRNEAAEVYANIGLDLPTAILIFLRRSVLAKGIPFSMTLSNDNYKAKLAVKALQGISDAAAVNGTRNITLDEINAEIAASRREREAMGK